MEISYEIRFEDYVEACNTFNLAVRKNKGKPVRTSWWAWTALALMTGLAIASVFITAGPANWNTDFDTREFAERSIHIAPWFALALIQFMYAWAARIGRKAGKIMLLSAGALTLVAAGFYQFATKVELDWTIFPWVFLFVQWSAFWRVLVGHTDVRAVWKKLSHLHRGHKLITSADGFEIADGLSSLRYQWRALQSWAESSSLFLLFISELSFHIIPKRGFPDQAALDDFRQCLVDASTSHQPAFPVIAAGRATAGQES